MDFHSSSSSVSFGPVLPDGCYLQALWLLSIPVVSLRLLQVRLYMDCEEHRKVAFSRSARPLTFEASSGIFVGNAGGTGLPRFVVSPPCAAPSQPSSRLCFVSGSMLLLPNIGGFGSAPSK